MIRTGPSGIACACCIIIGLSLAALSTLPLAHAGGRIWLVGEPSPGLPACEEFFDKWEVPGAPPGLLAMAGFSREVFAAKACLDKSNVPMACKHWQGLLVIIDKFRLPISESRGDIEKLMREHKCEANAEPNSGPQSKPGAPPEAIQGSDSTAAPGSGAPSKPGAPPEALQGSGPTAGSNAPPAPVTNPTSKPSPNSGSGPGAGTNSASPD